MSRRLKCSKHEDTDRLSNLPDELLVLILSSLPTRPAVRTTILSSRWKRLPLLINCLAIDDRRTCFGYEYDIQEKNYIKFVNKVLSSSIQEFHLDCSKQIYYKQFRAWIRAAILKGVEHLHLSLHGLRKVLPPRLFHCKTVVSLKLESCLTASLRLPKSTHLPSLKILHLKHIRLLDVGSFSRFISDCSSLQELDIYNYVWPMDPNSDVQFSSTTLKWLNITWCSGLIEVDSPNLQYLRYFCIYDVDVALSLKNSDSLVTASLEFCFHDKYDSIQCALALIRAVYNVKELYLLRGALQYLTRSDDYHIPSYPNLVKLKIGLCSHDSWKIIAYLLADSPQLATLVFNQTLMRGTERKEEWPQNVELLPFSSNVKVIEASRFRGYTTELVLLKYLLEKAKLLRQLILYKDRFTTTKEQELQAREELLEFPRASRACDVQFI